MSKLKLIHKAIQDILDTLPNHSKRIFLLEDYKPKMRTISIMYNTFRDESKCIYIDKNGAYIAGRGQGQGDKSKMYFSEFDQLELSQESKDYIQSEVNKIVNKQDTRIPTRQIKVGDLLREWCEWRNDDNKDYYVYLGKLQYEESGYYGKDKEPVIKHVYLSIDDKPNLVNIDNRYLRVDEVSAKSKKRFDQIVRKVNDNELEKLRVKSIDKLYSIKNEKWL